MPKVSVILPCFNHARFVTEAAESVLGQTHRDLELIITDDCSSDNSWEVIKGIAARDERVRIIRHEKNQGLPTSRNDGLRIATGEFIAFCDADDVWEPQKAAAQVELLLDNPTYDVVYCETLIIDEHSRLTGQRFSQIYPLAKVTSGWLFAELVKRNFINVQSAMMRKSCLKTVSQFDADLGVLEDWWYWVQLAPHHQFLYSPQPLARYRIHSQSMNSMKKRCFPVTRIRIYRRMLCKYPDLPRRTCAEIAYTMGVDLCNLKKCRIGRRLLWKSVWLAFPDPRAIGRLIKGVGRIAAYSASSK